MDNNGGMRHGFSRIRTLRASLLVLLVSLMMSGPASTQRRSTADDRPYDDRLVRLSEILGAIHYLRALCGSGEGQTWRKQMQNIVRAEGTTAIRRAKFVKGFNKGYRGYRRTYRSCTDTARTAIDRFMDEGEQIASLLVQQNR